MAINPLPSNLYSGEAERINLMPHVQFQTQLMAHKKAKDEALDEYYKKLPSTINSAGVRDQEREPIASKVNALQEFYIKNKDAIKNPKLDNGAARFTHEKMFRDVNDYVDQSKQEGKANLEFGKLRFQPGNEYLSHNDSIMDDVAASELPIGNPGHRHLDLFKMTRPSAQFDLDKHLKNFDDIKSTEGKPTFETNPTNKYEDIETTPKSFSADNLNVIRKRAESKLDNDYSFHDFIKTKIATDPNKVAELNENFKKLFNKPIENDYDLASAYTLSVLPQGAATTKSVDNGLKAQERQQAGFAHQELMRNLGLADSKKLIDYRQAAKDAGEENTWVQQFVDKTIEENKPTKSKLFGIVPATEKGFVPDPVLYNALGKPDRTSITKDGKMKVTYLMSDNKTIDDSRTTTLTPEQVKLAMGYKATTKKALGQEMKTKTTIPAKDKAKANPLGLDL